jgi:hypothetical protein
VSIIEVEAQMGLLNMMVSACLKTGVLNFSKGEEICVDLIFIRFYSNFRAIYSKFWEIDLVHTLII